MRDTALTPIPLLDAEPDLGRLLAPDRLADARRQLVVRRIASAPARGPTGGSRMRPPTTSAC